MISGPENFSTQFTVSPSGLVSLTSDPVPATGGTINGSLYVMGGRIGIGTTTPQTTIHIVNDTNNNAHPYRAGIISSSEAGYNSRFESLVYGLADNPGFFGLRAGGTRASPTTVAAGMHLLDLPGLGYDGTGWGGQQGLVAIQTSETWTPSAKGTDIVFSATAPGTTTLAEKVRIAGSGNVGIGTATPQAKLHIVNNVGTGFLDAYSKYQIILFDGQVGADTAYGLGITPQTLVFNAGGGCFSFDRAGTATSMYLDGSGNVGINEVMPRGKLDVRFAAPTPPTGLSNAVSGGMIISYGGEGAQFGTYDTGGGVWPTYIQARNTSTANLPRSLLLNPLGGSVGVNTSTPATALDVAGTIRSTTQSVPTSGAGLEIFHNAGTSYLLSYDRNGSAHRPLLVAGSTVAIGAIGSNAIYVDGSANVGIKTTTPRVALDVAGNIQIPDDTSSGALKIGNVGSYLSRQASDGSTILQTGQAYLLLNPGGGNVGIGTSSPAYRLDVVGAIRSNSEIISTYTFPFRSVYGSYGAFWHNNGGALYLMLTASGDQYGSYNGLRPLSVDLASGSIQLGNNALTVAHGGATTIQSLNVAGALTSSGSFGVTAPNTVDGIYLRSGSTGAYTAYSIGRASVESYWGIASSAGNFIGGSNPGDVILATQTTGRLHLSSGLIPGVMVDSNGWVSAGLHGANAIANNFHVNGAGASTALRISNTRNAGGPGGSLAQIGFSVNDGTHQIGFGNTALISVGARADVQGYMDFTTYGAASGMRLVANNLGIGTLAPAYSVDVVGSIRMRYPGGISAGVAGQSLFFSDSTPTNIAEIQSFDFDSSNYGLKFRLWPAMTTDVLSLKGNGTVGIMTSNPAVTLDVGGTMRVTGYTIPTSGAGVEHFYNGTGYVHGYNRNNSTYIPIEVVGSSVILRAYGGGSNNIGFAGTSYFTGSVGIGITPPGYTLDVNGIIHGYSDIRAEGNIGVNGGGLYMSGYLTVHSDALNTGYTWIYDNAGAANIGLNGGYTYYRNTTHYFQNRAANFNQMILDNGGLTVGGALQVNSNANVNGTLGVGSAITSSGAGGGYTFAFRDNGGITGLLYATGSYIRLWCNQYGDVASWAYNGTGMSYTGSLSGPSCSITTATHDTVTINSGSSTALYVPYGSGNLGGAVTANAPGIAFYAPSGYMQSNNGSGNAFYAPNGGVWCGTTGTFGGAITGYAITLSTSVNCDAVYTNFIRSIGANAGYEFHGRNNSDYYTTLYISSGVVRLDGNPGFLSAWNLDPGGGFWSYWTNAFKPGGGVWADSSDVRTKENIEDYTVGLAALEKLRPRTFRHNGRFGTKRDGRTFFGLVADEVLPVMPEMVGKTKPIDGEDLDTEILTIDATPMLYAMVNAIQTLSSRLAILEARL